MIELLFILLPIAALYGFVMGKRYSNNDKSSKKSSQLRFFIKGINYFMNRDTEKASDEFLHYFNSEGDKTYEEIIALGNIFRERGDLDSAIKFHQSLMTKEGLEPEQRSYALYELSKDFKKVGLLNKAEEILNELLSYNTERKRAAILLISIYEQEKDWAKALNLIETYKGVLGNTLAQKKAHFYCELANDEVTTNNTNKAIDLFKKALGANPKCFRAYFSLAKIYIEKEDFKTAVTYLEKAQETDPKMQDMLVKHLQKCFANLNDEEFAGILNKWLEKEQTIDVIIALADYKFSYVSKEEAEQFLMRILKVHPHIGAYAKLLTYRLSDLDPKSQERLAILKSLIETYQLRKPRFICKHCGFKSSILFWKCPSCQTWDGMKPTDSDML
ncbi:MAG: tetratricopeptide repeat protein [Ruminobacter sp.]|nr:tetratricopeptide repeat protein [Ruminobacter sp.]MDY5779357.1 tetratricopeptide repeat protein [Succinivibrionaceae bacterium]